MGVRIRVCLKCKRDFISMGVGNRLCLKCNESNREVFLPRQYVEKRTTFMVSTSEEASSKAVRCTRRL